MKCCAKVSREEQKVIFDRFWACGNFNLQNAFIRECIRVLQVARRRNRVNPVESRRGSSQVYEFKVG